VEARNFDIRKNVLKYDDVANDQRKVIFEQRLDLMNKDDLSETVTDMRHATVDNIIDKAIPKNSYPEQWDMVWLDEEIKRIFGIELPVVAWAKEEGIAEEEIKERLLKVVDEKMQEKMQRFSPEVMQQIEKAVIMQSLDHLWREHLVHLDHLRQVVGLRGYAQKDPLNEFKSEAFSLFENLLEHLREMATQQLSYVELAPPEPELPAMTSNFEAEEIVRDASDEASWGKVGRNEPCPCGSGKKFKHCHGVSV
jgi:preprotein translocase subunit SecA